jgi:WD40 repeat protein
MIYFALSTDFKLYVFNEHFNMIGWLPLNIRLVHFAHFCEEKSMLITAGIDGCFMFKIRFQSKYEPKQGVLLDPEG